MARDAELDRLKAAQDLAFQRKQAAHQAMQHAWDRRAAARDTLSQAHEAKQRAYAEQEAAWQDSQRIRSSNGPRIDQLRALQEDAFQNMRRAFDNASAAHDRRDGASARMYADEGHRHKADSQRYVAERRQLVDEIRAAKPRLDAAKVAFQYAKEVFSSAKRAFDQAKAEHERAQTEFKRAKAEADDVVKAFKARLEKVRAENRRRNDDKRSIAEKAGVPHQYRDNVWISKDSDGNTNIYFGGAGKPDGPGHGHYVLDRNGKVTYKRDPYDPHGAQNFARADDTGLLYIRSARSGHEPVGTNEHSGVFYRRSDKGGTSLHITQYFADKYHVSWDATPYGNENIHWTNQSLPDGHPDRFTPPPDAILL